MNFNKMTKQQLKDYGETIGIKLDLKKKKDVLIEELNKATVEDETVADMPVKQTQTGFDIKQYIWLIIFSILQIANTSLMNFPAAAGFVLGLIVKDGILLTLVAWVIMTKVMKREAWKWYDWLNMLAYTTVTARALDVMLIG